MKTSPVFDPEEYGDWGTMESGLTQTESSPFEEPEITNFDDHLLWPNVPEQEGSSDSEEGQTLRSVREGLFEWTQTAYYILGIVGIAVGILWKLGVI